MLTMAKPRDYKAEYAKYQGTEEQKKNRAKRNAANKVMRDAGRIKKGDGNDVDHKKPLSKGGGNSRSNLAVKPKSKNRSFARTASGKHK
tara:strand:+ start:193 stop:459 length:267 start_codon:yes stop_codon:yes gene_type:complete